MHPNCLLHQQKCASSFAAGSAAPHQFCSGGLQNSVKKSSFGEHMLTPLLEML
jgi:hypothetical protein